MKVILVCVALTATFTKSYSFVVSHEEIIFSATDTILNKPLPTTNIQNKVTRPGVSNASLCVDENGRTVYGLVEYKQDCRKFVSCGIKTETIMDCSAGTIFNKVIKNCDWPIKANCIEFKGIDKSKLVIPATEILW